LKSGKPDDFPLLLVKNTNKGERGRVADSSAKFRSYALQFYDTGLGVRYSEARQLQFCFRQCDEELLSPFAAVGVLHQQHQPKKTTPLCW
jgi:hypothetical protein